MQAYYGNLSAHACQRYGFLQAQERYKERASKNPLAGMVFRQVQSPPCSPYLLEMADTLPRSDTGVASDKPHQPPVPYRHSNLPTTIYNA